MGFAYKTRKRSNTNFSVWDMFSFLNLSQLKDITIVIKCPTYISTGWTNKISEWKDQRPPYLKAFWKISRSVFEWKYPHLWRFRNDCRENTSNWPLYNVQLLLLSISIAGAQIRWRRYPDVTIVWHKRLAQEALQRALYLQRSYYMGLVHNIPHFSNRMVRCANCFLEQSIQDEGLLFKRVTVTFGKP